MRSAWLTLAVLAAGCDVGTDTCLPVTPLGEIGEATGGYGQPCGSGCVSGLVCSDGTCRGARSIAPGERCDATQTEPCIDGYWCWRAEFGVYGECIAQLPRGAACSDDEACVPDLVCVNGACGDWPIAGERCSQLSRCAGGYFCRDGWCVAPPALEGDPCRPNECPTGLYCAITARCEPALAEGDECRSDRDDPGCGEGLYCNVRCQRPLAPGDACVTGDRCTDGTVCQLVDPDTGARRCDAFVERGGFCGDGQICEPGTYCDYRVHVEPSDCLFPPCP